MRFDPAFELREVLLGLRRPFLRQLVALGGTVAGVAAIVVITSMSASTRAAVEDRFERLRPTEVTAAVIPGVPGGEPPLPLDPQAWRRVGRLDGVEAAGQLRSVGARVSVSKAPDVPTGDTTAEVLTIRGELLGAVRGQLRGRSVDEDRVAACDVALIGADVARSLGRVTPGRSVVFLDGAMFSVLGIVTVPDRWGTLASGVIVPECAAPAFASRVESPGVDLVVVRTRPDSTARVAAVLAAVLDPSHPDRFEVSNPPDPAGLRSSVTDSLDGLAAALVASSLAFGVIGVANGAITRVLVRLPELGLRRAIGAHRSHLALSVVLDSAVRGLLASVVGAGVGLLIAVLWALARSSPVVVDVRIVVGSPVLGIVTGVLGGLQPALRAGRIEPVDALRNS